MRCPVAHRETGGIFSDGSHQIRAQKGVTSAFSSRGVLGEGCSKRESPFCSKRLVNLGVNRDRWCICV